ncbi:hypothetical protein GCM10010317_006510 [Streptomyces mirabilis]|nr:hypothetical protein GCM10010317_006510 [Streptomyces mirabilis]
MGGGRLGGRGDRLYADGQERGGGRQRSGRDRLTGDSSHSYSYCCGRASTAGDRPGQTGCADRDELSSAGPLRGPCEACPAGEEEEWQLDLDMSCRPQAIEGYPSTTFTWGARTRFTRGARRTAFTRMAAPGGPRGRLGGVHITGRDFAGGMATEYAKAEWG